MYYFGGAEEYEVESKSIYLMKLFPYCWPCLACQGMLKRMKWSPKLLYFSVFFLHCWSFFGHSWSKYDLSNGVKTTVESPCPSVHMFWFCLDDMSEPLNILFCNQTWYSGASSWARGQSVGWGWGGGGLGAIFKVKITVRASIIKI